MKIDKFDGKHLLKELAEVVKYNAHPAGTDFNIVLLYVPTL